MNGSKKYDLEAERGVIANLLNAQDGAELAERHKTCAGFTLAHFTDSRTPHLWAEIGKIVAQSGAIDLVHISQSCSIGLAELIQFQNEQPTTAHFKALRGRLEKAFKARETAREAQKIIELCDGQDFDPELILSKINRLRDVATDKAGKADLRDSLLSADELPDLHVTPRESFLGTWLREGSLGYLFGPRGLGKTWFALGIARAIAEGSDFGPWHASQPRRVLYIDGEMPLDSIKERDSALRTGPASMEYLNHERYFEKTGKSLNLTDPKTQQAVTDLLLETKTRVLFLDNLSCLFTQVKENDADEWEKVLPWLLNLRRHKIAVVIIHHSGRSGTDMRGTSRREDAAFWVIRLSDPSNGSDSSGFSFISQFTKNRDGSADETDPREWSFSFHSNGKTDIRHKRISPLDELRQWLRDGLSSCADLSEAMGISKPRVSKLAAQAMRQGWLKKNGREYELNEPLAA